MRNLGDLNDLYNTQDVILLCDTSRADFKPYKILMVSTQENAIQQVQ